jgi:YbgC/YbaW family acyl-CoA thioester hydrolase
MSYEFPVTVEFEDIDHYGIMHHPKSFYYFERARVHFFKENGIDLNRISFGVVLRNATIQFKTPLLFMDAVIIRMENGILDQYRFSLDYRIIKECKTAIQCSIEFCIIDLATKKLIPVPENMAALLKSIRTETPSA